MLNTRNTLGTAPVGRGRSGIVGVLLAVAALVLLATGVRAQDADLVGIVVDSETGAPLAGAWIGLTGTDWGAISDPAGAFRIPDQASGPIDLTIEMLGYRTLRWTDDVVAGEAPRIGLDPEPVLLEGIEVMTDRFRARRNAVPTSTMAFGTDHLTRSTTMNARDFIAAQAGVFMTACNGRRGNSCVWLRGRQIEPLVYVDEFPHVGGMDYLASFSPGEFHMIEVYDRGRHIRAYTPQFMKRVAERRIAPVPITNLGR